MQENREEMQYLELCESITFNGIQRTNRTNVETISIFAPNPLRFDISERIPLLTTKKMGWKTIIKELLWFLRGDTDVKILQKQNVHIWDGNSSREFLFNRNLQYQEGVLGPAYGWQWRHFGAEYNESCADSSINSIEIKGFDQIKNIEYLLKNDPFSRRIILTAWNPCDLDKVALPSCHIFCQFYVENPSTDSISKEKLLSAQVYLRSSDVFLGLPFNIFSYAILIYIFAKKCNMKPHKLIMTLGDAHLYTNTIEQTKEQIKRTPFQFPEIVLDNSIITKDYSEITVNDFILNNYFSHNSIKADMVA